MPLIFITNDDGITSPGLRAVAYALADVADLLIVAPAEQQTAMGRSYPIQKITVTEFPFVTPAGQTIRAYSMTGSPAQCVRGGVQLIAAQKPDLIVSGINYGENVGAGITVSGTVGAALEGATHGIPSIAVSLETEKEHHLSNSEAVDFVRAAEVTRRLVVQILAQGFPAGVDVLKVDIPSDIEPHTPMVVTRVSRQSYFASLIEEIEGKRQYKGYDRAVNLETLEADSDIHALMVQRAISVTPLTFDLTAREALSTLPAWLE